MTRRRRAVGAVGARRDGKEEGWQGGGDACQARGAVVPHQGLLAPDAGGVSGPGAAQQRNGRL